MVLANLCPEFDRQNSIRTEGFKEKQCSLILLSEQLLSTNISSSCYHNQENCDEFLELSVKW